VDRLRVLTGWFHLRRYAECGHIGCSDSSPDLLRALPGVSNVASGLFLTRFKNSVVKYETSVKAGKFVPVAHGAAEEAAKACDLLKTSGAEQIDGCQPSNEAAARVA
jgi:hypothetical protein